MPAGIGYGLAGLQRLKMLVATGAISPEDAAALLPQVLGQGDPGAQGAYPTPPGFAPPIPSLPPGAGPAGPGPGLGPPLPPPATLPPGLGPPGMAPGMPPGMPPGGPMPPGMPMPPSAMPPGMPPGGMPPPGVGGPLAGLGTPDAGNYGRLLAMIARMLAGGGGGG